MLGVSTIEEVWNARDSLRPATVPLPFGADADPFALLGGRTFDELKSQIVADGDVGPLKGQMPEFELLTGSEATLVKQGQVPDEQMTQQPFAERRMIRPPATCNSEKLRLGLVERGQLGIIAKRRWSAEDADSDIPPWDEEFRGNPLVAGLEVPERHVRRAYGSGTAQGGVYLDMQEYEVFEPVGLNANLALEEVLIYNAAKQERTAAALEKYVNDMLSVRSPGVVWYERYFMGGAVYEQVPSTRPGTSLHHTTGGWHMPKPAWAPSGMESGGRDSLRRLEGRANTTFITGGVYRGLMDYSGGAGTTLYARTAFIFKRFPITSKTVYKILAGGADYDYEGTALGPYAAGMSADFSVPDLDADETLYALQLAPVTWSFGTQIPCEYKEYTIEEPQSLFARNAVAFAAAAAVVPPKAKYQCFDGIAIDVGYVFARPNMTKANERQGGGRPSVHPSDLKPCMDNQAITKSLAAPPIDFFVNFDREHN